MSCHYGDTSSHFSLSTLQLCLQLRGFLVESFVIRYCLCAVSHTCHQAMPCAVQPLGAALPRLPCQVA
jgi:hypothetical protein